VTNRHGTDVEDLRSTLDLIQFLPWAVAAREKETPRELIACRTKRAVSVARRSEIENAATVVCLQMILKLFNNACLANTRICARYNDAFRRSLPDAVPAGLSDCVGELGGAEGVPNITQLLPKHDKTTPREIPTD